MTSATRNSLCHHLLEKLSEYLDQELEENACRQIEEHLQNCATCRACKATLQKTIDLCRQLKAREVPEDVSARLQAAIQNAIGKSRPPEFSKL